jgi:hypothetical protein
MIPNAASEHSAMEIAMMAASMCGKPIAMDAPFEFECFLAVPAEFAGLLAVPAAFACLLAIFPPRRRAGGEWVGSFIYVAGESCLGRECGEWKENGW